MNEDINAQSSDLKNDQLIYHNKSVGSMKFGGVGKTIFFKLILVTLAYQIRKISLRNHIFDSKNFLVRLISTVKPLTKRTTSRLA